MIGATSHFAAYAMAEAIACYEPQTLAGSLTPGAINRTPLTAGGAEFLPSS